MTGGLLRFLRGNMLALIALFIALGGTTYAATALPKNSVGPKQLKKNAVTAPKIKAGSVTGAKIGANAITGANIKDDSLTGADILESSLGKVPSAANADHASAADSATNATNATNATTLGGYHATDLARGTSAVTIVNTSTTVTKDIITAVNAPTAGGFLINVDLSCASFSGTTNTRWDWSPQVDGATKGIGQVLFFPHAAVATQVGDSGSTSVFVPVSAGAHTVGFTASRLTGDGSLDCNIIASSLFVPFNNAGAASSPVTAPTSPSQGGANTP